MIAEAPSTSDSDLIGLINELQTVNSQLKNENRYLKEQLAWLTRQLFGKRSEKFIEPTNQYQPLLPGFEFPQTPEEEKQTIPSHERKKRKSTGKDSITLPPDLPVERHVIDLPEEEKFCAETGR